MKIELYETSKNPPPKDGSSFIGVFMRDWQTFIDFCYYDCEAHTWILHKFSMEDFKYDPILWIDRYEFKQIICDNMSKEIQKQQ